MFVVKESISAMRAKKLANNALESKKQNELISLFEEIERRASNGYFEYTIPILHNDVVSVKKLLEEMGYSVFSIQNVVTMNWE